MSKLYITITSKPITIAAKEQLPAVEASVYLSELSDSMLINLINEAQKRLEA